jgi:Protein of unknown function (DUF3631)
MLGRPWAEVGKHGKPLTQTRLASLLRPFHIYPTLVGPERLSGYQIAAFLDTFARYGLT